MASSISILPVSSSDLPILSDFLYTSKLSLTINRLLIRDWPNEIAQRKTYSGAIEGGFANPSSEFLKAVDPSTGDILGFVVLTRKYPETTELPNKEESGTKKPSVPESMNPEVYWAVVEAAADIGRETENLDRFEITYIYVKPSGRRAGIGSQLMQECFIRAKAAGIPLVTSTEPAGHPFFSKHGFNETKKFDFELNKWAMPYSGFGIFRLAGLIWNP